MESTDLWNWKRTEYGDKRLLADSDTLRPLSKALCFITGTLSTWCAVNNRGPGSPRSLGASRSRPPRQSGDGGSVTQLLPGSLPLRPLAWEWTAGCGSGSPPCLESLSIAAFLLSLVLECVMSTAGWGSSGGRRSDGESQCDCVSVSDCWLLEYKWDVLIHLNQGHMLGPRVECCERNQALCCSCQPAQEIPPGAFSALHETTPANLQIFCCCKLTAQVTWFEEMLQPCELYIGWKENVLSRFLPLVYIVINLSSFL